MVTLLALWERGWFDLKVESFMWRQLANAYGVKKYRVFEGDLVFMGVEGVRVFLDPFEGEVIDNFQHPQDAVYVFGRAGDNNRRWKQSGDLTLRIPTLYPCDLFAVQAAAIVLDDRRRKRGDR